MIRRILVQLLAQAPNLLAEIRRVFALEVDRFGGEVRDVGMRDLPPAKGPSSVRCSSGFMAASLPGESFTIFESDSPPERSRKVSSRMSLRTPGAKSGP